MKRNGKIAQLPESIRSGLNIYLYLNHSGTKILNWLNKLPEVKAIIDRCFGGRLINRQNLSEWRNGGYKEWHTEFTSTPSLIESDPVFRQQYFSLLDSYLRDARDRLQRDIVHQMLEALKQDRLKNSPAQANPANN